MLFSRYQGKEVELVGYTTCGGCPGGNIEYVPAEMKSNGAEVVHSQSVSLVGYPPCPHIEAFCDFLRQNTTWKLSLERIRFPRNTTRRTRNWALDAALADLARTNADRRKDATCLRLTMNDYIKTMRPLIGPRPMLLPGVRALIFNPQGKILLQRRTDMPCWCLPSGSVELDETALDAIKREVAEETSLVVGEAEAMGVYSGHAEVHLSQWGRDSVFLHCLRSVQMARRSEGRRHRRL